LTKGDLLCGTLHGRNWFKLALKYELKMNALLLVGYFST